MTTSDILVGRATSAVVWRRRGCRDGGAGAILVVIEVVEIVTVGVGVVKQAESKGIAKARVVIVHVAAVRK